MHEKLSSPSRRRLAEPCEAFQQHEAKQLRAQQHRAALQEEKSRKRRDLAKRMDEVRTAKNLLVDQRKQLLERKMKQAEEKRMKHLAEIVKKAHDEEEKKKEIAFINVLEAQIKRHDFITHIQTQEERIQGLHVTDFPRPVLLLPLIASLWTALLTIATTGGTSATSGGAQTSQRNGCGGAQTGAGSRATGQDGAAAGEATPAGGAHRPRAAGKGEGPFEFYINFKIWLKFAQKLIEIWWKIGQNFIKICPKFDYNLIKIGLKLS